MTPSSGASSSLSCAYIQQIPRSLVAAFACSSTSIATGPHMDVTDRADVARLVKRNAASMGLDSLSMRSLDAVIQQTSEAASGSCR